MRPETLFARGNFFAAFALLVLLPSSGQSQTSNPQTASVTTAGRLNALALPFIANTGQTDPRVGFYADTFAGRVYVTKSGELVYSLPPKDGKPGWALVERFASGQAKPVGETPNVTHVSYIRNRNGKAVTDNAETYGSVGFGEVYSGVRVSLIAHGKNVEKVYTVAPGADPKLIKMEVSGANDLAVNEDGTLVAKTENGPFTLSCPIAWQEKQGQKVSVPVSYALHGKQYSFHVGDYDQNLPVVIDPLIQATYFGGNGSEAAWAINIHPITGDVYVLGRSTSPGSGFADTLPGTGGGWQSKRSVDSEAGFILRASADLKTLFQVTYLEASQDAPYVVFEHKSNQLFFHKNTGDVYLWGTTLHRYYGHNKPFPQIENGALKLNGDEGDSKYYVARFSSDLTQLKSASYLGRVEVVNGSKTIIGDYTAVAASQVANDIYFVGSGGYVVSGGNEALITRISADLVSSIDHTHIGGSGNDHATFVAVHPITGDVYVGGDTDFNDFPNTSGGFQPANSSTPATGMQSNGFLAVLSPDLTTLKRATYVGGPGTKVQNLSIDKAGSAVTVVYPDFPNQIVAKISTDLATVNQSTTLTYNGPLNGELLFSPFDDRLYFVGGYEVGGSVKGLTLVRAKSDLSGPEAGRDHLDYDGFLPESYAFSPLSGDFYVIATQLNSRYALPGTTGGFQESSQTTNGGRPDMVIERYTLGDTGSQPPGSGGNNGGGSTGTGNGAGSIPSGSGTSNNGTTPNLSVSASDNTVQIGQAFSYSINFNNFGAADARGVKFSAKLPKGVSVVSTTSSSGACSGKTKIVCNFGNVSSNSTVSVSITAVASKAGVKKSNAILTYKMPKSSGSKKLKTRKLTSTVQVTVRGSKKITSNIQVT